MEKNTYTESGRLNHVPVIFARGTNYEIGLSVGRTFGSMIQDFLLSWDFFTEDVLPKYSTLAGKIIYDDTLNVCKRKYPLLIEELRGLAEGAGIAFHKIFLLHIDEIAVPLPGSNNETIQADSGCTSILCNNNELILAHNEDCLPEHVNRFYIVCAEVIDENGKMLESFSSYAYAGFLPGYTSGYNAHGIVHSCNTLVAKERYPQGTPRSFICRAILGASSLDQILDIVRDEGTGISDGFSLNLCVYKPGVDPVMYNIEIAPPLMHPGENFDSYSQVDVVTINPGESYVHCNRYLHLKVPELTDKLSSTIHRHEAVTKLPEPNTLENIKKILSDQSNPEYPIYRRFQLEDKDKAKTAATIIFDIHNRKWMVFTDPANNSNPTATLHMDFSTSI